MRVRDGLLSERRNDHSIFIFKECLPHPARRISAPDVFPGNPVSKLPDRTKLEPQKTLKKRSAPTAVRASAEIQKRRTARITLKDVAREANVSVMTVSNVINGKLHLVRPQTQKIVNEVISRLNYRPFSRARSLRLSREFVVGLIIVDPSPRFLTDLFNTHVVAGLGNYMNERGYALSLQGVSADRIDNVPVLKHLQTDALCVIVSGGKTERQEIYKRFEAARQPLLVLQDQVPAFLTDAMSVRQDDFGGGAILARHVLSKGARKLLFMNEAHNWPALENRLAGMAEEVKHHGDGATLAVAACQSVREQHVVAALDDHIARKGMPDGILCGNDLVAALVLKRLGDRKVDVPNDVRVTGFNAFDISRHAASLPLTTVRSPAYELGEAAGERILERLDHGRFEQRDLILSVQIETGKSA